MEWTNEKCIEFLEAFRTEPCLWDPKTKSHKSRNAQADAWRRIVELLSFPSTIEQLKKKKEALMGYYRIHLNKYKKSLKSGAAASDIYSTNWFAFDIMHSFLQPIYVGDITVNTESITPESQSSASQGSPSDPTIQEARTSRTNVSVSPREHTDSLLSNVSTGHRSIKLPAEIKACRKQMDEALSCLKAVTSQKQGREFDEYDHFGLLIAAKIRKLNDDYEKEIVMNTIQNVVFESTLKVARAKRNPTPSCSSNSIPWEQPYPASPLDLDTQEITVSPNINQSSASQHKQIVKTEPGGELILSDTDTNS